MPFKVTYRICQPTNFRAQGISDQVIKVGDAAFDIYVDFDQSPCSFKEKFSFEIQDPAGIPVLIPGFLTILNN